MSTEFRIGMSEGRNSSRVLKPPGGGQSQIFGDAAADAPRKIHAKTEISGCFGSTAQAVRAPAMTEDKIDSQQVREHEENTTNGNNVAENGTNGSTPEKVIQAEEKKNEINGGAKTVSTPERKRVPPGGFSSGGFW